MRQPIAPPACIGFIGLGVMGRPMARNLMDAGYRLMIFNRSQEVVSRLVAEGAVEARDLAHMAQQCEAIITMLPDTAAVESVMAGPDGLIANAHPMTLLIDMSTISPKMTLRLRELARARACRLLDAPVTGGQQGAIDATLSIMVGGEQEDLDRARPLFDTMGKTVTLCGPAGHGQLAKACNQIAVAIIIEGVAEALAFAKVVGLPQDIMVNLLKSGLAQSRVLDLRGDRMAAHEFTPGFKARLHRKDLAIVRELMNEQGVDLPATIIVEQMFDRLFERGQGDLDHTAILTVLEGQA